MIELRIEVAASGLFVRIAQHREKIEAATAEGRFLNAAEVEVAHGVDPDEQHPRVVRTERDEVPDIGFQAADFLPAHIERMHEGNIEGCGLAAVVRRLYGCHEERPIRIEMACGMACAASRGMVAAQRR